MAPCPQLFGRDPLIDDLEREIRKGHHVLLTGPIGSGKSALLVAALQRIEPRESEWYQFDPVAGELEDEPIEPAPLPETPGRHDRVMVYVSEHQGKAQFVQMARRLLETGILKPSALELARKYDDLPPAEIEWKKIRRNVNRLSMRDLTQAIIPAIYEWEGRILIGVDDLTALTPTQQAFWLAILEHAQVVGCASSRKSGLSKLWWKMKHVAVPPLDSRAAAALVRDYIARHGVLIESPGLYIGHVVKQANGNPQAIMDMLESSAREKRLDKRQIREMRHAAGLTYVDFTPVMLIAGAAIIGTRYLAIGLGDTALYVMAGMGAALFLSLRVFAFKGSRGKTSG